MERALMGDSPPFSPKNRTFRLPDTLQAPIYTSQGDFTRARLQLARTHGAIDTLQGAADTRHG